METSAIAVSGLIFSTVVKPRTLSNGLTVHSIAKDELDQLDRLEGKFFVHAAVMEVRRRGKILSNDEWKSLKTSGLPKVIIRFLDSKKKEFSILERSNHGKREWELQDVDGSSKKFNFSSTVTDDHGGWRHKEQFIIDGQLTTYRC